MKLSILKYCQWLYIVKYIQQLLSSKTEKKITGSRGKSSESPALAKLAVVNVSKLFNLSLTLE
jgi:hypothetical protein